MLPPNWGRAHAGPRRYEFQTQGHWVRERYRALGGRRQVDEVFDLARRGWADGVYIDSPYIDLDYRSDHSHFYGRAFRPPPDVAERLVFTKGDDVLGFSVVRPLPQPVGRSMLAPPASIERFITCQADGVVNAFGQELPVRGFPFTSQDGDYGVCAHAAIWSIARYHHLRFGTDRYTVSGIIDAAGMRERADRTARSHGLYAFDIIRAFRGIGLPALVYDADDIPDPENIDRVMCRYLNSGIPVGIATANHAIVACGYGERDDGTIFYFVADDNHGPYQRVDAVPAGDSPDAWVMLFIPMPGRIHVSGEAAETRAEQVFEDRVRAEATLDHLLQALMGDGLRVRSRAVTSMEYVKDLVDRGLPNEIVQHHIYTPKAHWLWVSEFQDKTIDGPDNVVGEIAIDATSLRLDPSPLFGSIDGRAYSWDVGDEEPNVVEFATGLRHRSGIGDRREAGAPAPQPAPPLAPQGPAVDTS